MKKLLPFIGIFMFVLWVIVLPIRSAIYVKRIVDEFTKPIPGYFESIDPCELYESFKNYEEERYYNYLKLDAKCEK